MDKKIVGTVTQTEKEQILTLFERKSALNELLMVLGKSPIKDSSNSDLYEKMVSDMGDTIFKLDNWWKVMFEKYLWESAENGRWEIDFNTNEIYLFS